jgi:hypothetical protein
MPTWGEIGNQLLADTGAEIASFSPFGGLTEQEKNDWYRINEATRTPAADFGNKLTNIASTVGAFTAAPTVLPMWAGAAKNAVSGGLGIPSLAPGAAATEMGAVGIPGGTPTMMETAKSIGTSALPYIGGLLAMNRGGEATPVTSTAKSTGGAATPGAKGAAINPTADPAYASYLGEYQKAYDLGDFAAAYRATDAYYKSKGIPFTTEIANGIVKAFKAKEEASNPSTPAPGAPPIETQRGPSPQETKELEFMKHAIEQVKQITGVDPNQDISKLALQNISAGPMQTANGSWVSGNAAYQLQYEQNLAKIKPAYDYAQKMVGDMVTRFRAMNPPEAGHIVKENERYIAPGTEGTGIIEGNKVLKPGEQVVPAGGGSPIVNPNKPATTPLTSAQLDAQTLAVFPRIDTVVRSQISKDPAKLKALDDDLRTAGLITNKEAGAQARISAYKKAAPSLSGGIDGLFRTIKDEMHGSQRMAGTAVPTTSTPSQGVFWNGMNGQVGTGTKRPGEKFFRSSTGKTYDMKTNKEVDPSTI